MAKKSNTYDFLSKLKEKYGDKYDYSEIEYVNSFTKIKVICHHKDNNGVEHGEFFITPSNLLTGYGCPKCAKEQTSIRKRLPYDEFQNKINNLNGEGIYIIDKYTYENKPYEFDVFCTRHNITFKSNGSNMLNYKSHFCPECVKDLYYNSAIKTLRSNDKVETCEQPTLKEDILNRINNGEEVWVPVKGYENDYIVSSNGRVKKINRTSRFGNKLHDILIQEHVDKRHMRRVNISLNNKTKSLHKIVFESFYDMTIPKGYAYTIDHIDTNPLNNSILNLRLCNGIRDNMLNNNLTKLHLSQRIGHNQKLILEFDDLENEIWTACIGYEGLYSVSNKGRVKSEGRLLVENNTGVIRKKKPHLMRLYNKDDMHYTVGLTDKNGKHKDNYVHKLIYESFNGKINNGNQVGHIDGNTLNNNLENLRECTPKEICNNKIKSNNTKKGKIKRTRLILIDKNNNTLKEFVSYVDAAQYFNVNWTTIERYINKCTKKLKVLPKDTNLIRKED